jgi:hypothetical protein
MPISNHEADDYLRRIVARLPAPLGRAIRFLRRPERRWLRIPIAVLFVAGGLLWFLPVVGLWMLPLGLLLLAEESPPVKRRLAAVFMAVETWWQRRRGG